ncbi:MAG: hypothetical protein R6V59_03340 [Dehalococcoidia bacterium]
MGENSKDEITEKVMRLVALEKLDKDFFHKLRAELDERSEPFDTALQQPSDRATAIISTCLLDDLLERLLRTFYIKDPAVKSIFRDDHILQSFYAKINIAYFSGLIPKAIYHDLKLVCEIRNRFAHEVTADLGFDSTVISQRIAKCELRPKTMDDVTMYRIKFIIILQQLIDHLCFLEHLLLSSSHCNLVEAFKLNDWKWGEAALTKEKIADIVERRAP